MNKFCNLFLPTALSRLIISQSAKNYDFIISNVPGSPDPLFVNGMKLESIRCMTCPGAYGSLISIFTYMNKVKLFLSVDKAIECDEKDYMKYVEKEIDNIIERVKTN